MAGSWGKSIEVTDRWGNVWKYYPEVGRWRLDNKIASPTEDAKSALSDIQTEESEQVLSEMQQELDTRAAIEADSLGFSGGEAIGWSGVESVATVSALIGSFGTFLGVQLASFQKEVDTGGEVPVDNVVEGGEKGLNKRDLIRLVPLVALSAAKIVPAWVGFCPLYYVDNLNFGKSDRTLKYRSSGGLFLAHQKGEYDGLAIRLKFYLYGPSKYAKLQALDELRDLTASRLEAIDEGKLTVLNNKFTTEFKEQIKKGKPPEEAWQIVQNKLRKDYADTIKEFNFAPYNNTFQVFRPEGIKFPKWIGAAGVYAHKPIPFVSEDIVLRSTYIESLVVNHNSRHPDLLEAEMMIRKYMSPDEIDITRIYPGGGLQETNKQDITDRFLNYILRFGGTIVDCSYSSFNSVTCYNILDMFKMPINIGTMAVKRLTLFFAESTTSKFNVFSPNPGDINVLDYEWDEINYNKRAYPIVEKYENYTFAFSLQSAWTRKSSGKENADCWLRLTIYDSNKEIIFNEKIVSKLMYHAGDLEFYVDQMLLTDMFPAKNVFRMLIRNVNE